MKIRKNQLIAPHTHFGLGGRAAGLLLVPTSEELIKAVQAARAEGLAFVIIGGGSNILCADGRINKLIIVYREERYRAQSFILRGEEIECDGGVMLEHLIKFANKNSLAGIELLTGIPGTVGGAVVGAAGAYGEWITDLVSAAQVLDEKGRVKWLTKKQCRFGHKDSIFKHQNLILLRVRLRLLKGKKEELEKKTREVSAIRRKKFGHVMNCSAGSYFKNVLIKDVPKAAWAELDRTKITGTKVKELPAGYLLDLVGAKGMKEGGARVTDFHANIIVNTGRGKARDVRALAEKLKKKVRARFGIELEEEVRYIE